MTTRFVVCGETLIDLIQADEQPAGFLSSTWSALSAGGPMNSAVALGRLGADVALPRTAFPGRVRRASCGRHIDAAGVALDLATESSQATSIAVVSLDDAGQWRATRSTSPTPPTSAGRTTDLPTLVQDDWLHIASLATRGQPGC